MNNSIVAGILGVVLLAIGITAKAQSAEALPAGYIPLFSQEQIDAASPQAKSRMIETEQRNRKAWIERSKRRSASSGGDTPSASARAERESEPSAAAPAPRPKKRKIYRWVDANGRVNFGDTPPAAKHEEVSVRGTAAPTGAPSRAPRPSLITESD